MPTAKVRQSRRKKTAAKTKKVSRTHKPEEMDLRDWQVALRRQFGREQSMVIRNLGPERVFSEYAVTNPATQGNYRVVIRGEAPGVNFCSCPDYAINTLGTCKHIEAVLHRLRKRNKTALRRGFHPPFSEVYVRYGDRRAIVFAPGADCPPELRTHARTFFDADGTLKPEAFEHFDRFLMKASRIDHDLRVYDDTVALAAEVRDDHARRTRMHERYGGRGKATLWNRLLNVRLFPYQREGALFAAQAGRAIIADEMGLGKTIQAIAAAEVLARECGVERVLVVCPASLKSQWKQEIERFSSRVPLVIEGLTHHRTKLYQQDDGFFKIVNYDVVHRDLDAIHAWSPDLVVLDEAQRIKNWQTRAAKSVKKIESRYAIVLTGTPLENRLDELHSIVEFVDRYRLGPLFAFKAAHEIIEAGSTKVVGYQDLGRVSKTLAPILIRRTKKQVLDQLPPRMDKNFFVPMTEPQWIPHDENKETVARLVHKWRTYKFLTEADQLRMRIALQYMRMSCDNTYLVDHETRHGTKVAELAQVLDEVFEQPEAKVVIFSQWVRMNELVAEMLDDRGWGHVHLHGGVPSGQRKHLTRALREDKHCRVFLSTDAGGVGLNLQTASTVVNMDIPWNPAVLEQRIGRVHRLGQKRPVRVVNFVSEGTIEHGMLSLLAFKKSMFAGVLDGAADKVLMGDSAMNRFMKTVEKATSSIPQVSPTPTEAEAAGPRSDAAIAQDQQPTAAGTASELDVAALGQVLTQGAEMLLNLGRALAEPDVTAHKDAAPGLQPRITTDNASGRPELRIALPDEKTLQQWVGQLSNVIGQFRSR